MPLRLPALQAHCFENPDGAGLIGANKATVLNQSEPPNPFTPVEADPLCRPQTSAFIDTKSMHVWKSCTSGRIPGGRL